MLDDRSELYTTSQSAIRASFGHQVVRIELSKYFLQSTKYFPSPGPAAPRDPAHGGHGGGGEVGQQHRHCGLDDHLWGRDPQLHRRSLHRSGLLRVHPDRAQCEVRIDQW